jgi:pimeloyl-ACP methyl ester carboxylesterase
MVALFHRIYGDKQPAIIIAHGLFGMADNWHNIAQKLQESHQVITVDLRNHGHSPHHPDMSYADMVADLLALIMDLNLEKPILVGHSMGGKLMMHFAALHPQHVSKLVIVDIASKAYPKGHEIYFTALFELTKTTVSSRSEAQHILEKFVKDPAILQFLLKSLYRTSEGTYKLRMNVEAIYQHYDEIRSAVHFDWPVSVPTLFVKGENSNYIEPEDEHAISEMFTDVQIESIQNAGHWLHADNPAAFIQTLQQFLLS